MNIEIIRQISLFSSLPPVEFERLAESLHVQSYAERDLLFEEGRIDDHFLVILEGQVEVIKAQGTDEEHWLGMRDRGALMGEMSLFSQGGFHTASVRAMTPVQALVITRQDFDDLLLRQPRMAYEIVRMISKRLEDSENMTILDLREKNLQLTRAYQELKAAQAQIIEKEKMERELEIARQIQRNILPHQLPSDPYCDFGALMVPARAVGGDFYDFIPLGECRWGIVVGDVSDKGVPAALFMSMVYSLVRTEALRAGSPGETLSRVNRHLSDMEISSMFVTLLFGVLDSSTREFSYARAGHPYPVILDGEGKVMILPHRTGQPLALFDSPVLDEHRLVIPPGGMFVMYSDGLSEAMNSRSELFGTERLEQLVSSYQQENAQGVCEALWKQVLSFCEPLPQQDDFSVVSVKCR